MTIEKIQEMLASNEETKELKSDIRKFNYGGEVMYAIYLAPYNKMIEAYKSQYLKEQEGTFLVKADPVTEKTLIEFGATLIGKDYAKASYSLNGIILQYNIEEEDVAIDLGQLEIRITNTHELKNIFLTLTNEKLIKQ